MRVAKHDDQLRTGFLGRIFEAAQDVMADDPARDPGVERITIVQIEYVINIDPRIDAAHKYGERVLPALARLRDLGPVVRVIPDLARDKPRVTLLQSLKGRCWRHSRLRFFRLNALSGDDS